jgi:hypothetical protein
MSREVKISHLSQGLKTNQKSQSKFYIRGEVHSREHDWIVRLRRVCPSYEAVPLYAYRWQDKSIRLGRRQTLVLQDKI